MQSMERKSEKKAVLSLLAGMVMTILVLFQPMQVQAVTPIKGIDVSRWQGTIDWAKVKADGVKYAMIGVGSYYNGIGYPDIQLKNNLQNAISQGIHVGVYLYSQAVTEEQAREEAKFVLDQISGYRISYPVAFDIEDTVHTKLTTKERTDITIAFLEVIEEAGYYPMIYASESWFRSMMDLTRLTKYDKWVARWASSTSFTPLSMWQYSATGKVAGINGDVDLDYSYKDYSKIITPRKQPLPLASAGGWKTDGTNYWYVNADGSIPKQCFKVINGNTYYFNANGYRVTGWQKIGGKQYYFVKKTGVMKKGWMSLSSKEKYYFNPTTGVMATGFVNVSGKTFYLDSRGCVVKKKGWHKIGGRYYYLTKTGRVWKGWLTLNGKRYYMRKDNGRRIYGWLKYNGKMYYLLKGSGVMKKNWLTLKGKKYYMGSDGAMKLGWVTVSGNKYYMGTDGVMKYGWQKINGKWYYFQKTTGVMQKNKKIGKYRLNAYGVCTNRK